MIERRNMNKLLPPADWFIMEVVGQDPEIRHKLLMAQSLKNMNIEMLKLNCEPVKGIEVTIPSLSEWDHGRCAPSQSKNLL